MSIDRYNQEESADPLFEIALPRPGALIQSLRAFGYDLATAIADLMDNSISAGARNIWLDFIWEGEDSQLLLADDGRGMSDTDLVNAMRPGSQNPLDTRHPRDLGRFGLGLKTASFSQCRRLTVASRPEGSGISIRCWDLNYVTQCDEWRLLHTGYPDMDGFFSRLPEGAAGTLVVWEDMDRLVPGARVDSIPDENRFLEHIERVRRHIAMVFHRFLERPDPLRIWLNGRLVAPWDPFLRNEPATQLLTAEPLSLRGERITVRPYVLPHHTRISSETHELAAGPKGWNAAQGFYVYRNDRLLVDGDWLGLGFQKEEHCKLARILLDIPNTLDGDWEIDVKKSRARPPAALRDDLKRLARLTRARAVEIYRHRGRVYTRHQGTSAFVMVWDKKLHRGRVSYTINREHPLVKEALSGGAGGAKLHALLRLLEETVPIPLIVIDHAEQPDQHQAPFESASPEGVREVLMEVFAALRTAGLSVEEARERLGQMEPFDRYPEMIAIVGEEDE